MSIDLKALAKGLGLQTVADVFRRCVVAQADFDTEPVVVLLDEPLLDREIATQVAAVEAQVRKRGASPAPKPKKHGEDDGQRLSALCQQYAAVLKTRTVASIVKGESETPKNNNKVANERRREPGGGS